MLLNESCSSTADQPSALGVIAQLWSTEDGSSAVHHTTTGWRGREGLVSPQIPSSEEGNSFYQVVKRCFSFSWIHTCWCAHSCRFCSGSLLLGTAVGGAGAGGSGCLVSLGTGCSFLLCQQLKPSLYHLLPRLVLLTAAVVDACCWGPHLEVLQIRSGLLIALCNSTWKGLNFSL